MNYIESISVIMRIWYAPLPFDTRNASVLAIEVCTYKCCSKCRNIGILENPRLLYLLPERKLHYRIVDGMFYSYVATLLTILFTPKES